MDDSDREGPRRRGRGRRAGRRPDRSSDAPSEPGADDASTSGDRPGSGSPLPSARSGLEPVAPQEPEPHRTFEHEGVAWGVVATGASRTGSPADRAVHLLELEFESPGGERRGLLVAARHLDQLSESELIDALERARPVSRDDEDVRPPEGRGAHGNRPGSGAGSGDAPRGGRRARQRDRRRGPGSDAGD